ncbi:MAG: hypothetical protein IJE62_05880 [Clostridia bacterium]|nr:hypothetical protein [Clostridia bacterium]MBQ2932352.1 hypothetical protein [Clostridia bacterium]MBQ7122389.1 hypothetical protein [Clostridia bacterium]
MKQKKTKTYHLDGDFLKVEFIYDELSKRYLGEYPEFSEEPRYTPNGRKWVDVITEDCPFADGEDKTCGTCSFMLKQDKKDIIGVCMNDNLKKE